MKHVIKIGMTTVVLFGLVALFAVRMLELPQEVIGQEAAKQLAVSDERSVRLVAVGDIMPSRSVAITIKQKGNNYPFAATKEYFASADIVFANLESPITPGRVIKPGEMTFRTNPDMAMALKIAGVSIVSLANNHTMNFGAKGLQDTFRYLQKSGIQFVGAGEDDTQAYASVYTIVQGLKIAWLAYNDPSVVPVSYKARSKHPGTAFLDIPRMIASVKAERGESDFVIVSMHNGTEYQNKPNASQVRFAHAAIDAGADLVIGHHPHVIETLELYRGKYIFYSLGNFVFDQMWSQPTREGLMIRAQLTKHAVQSIDLFPVVIENSAQPRVVEGKLAASILRRLNIPIDGSVLRAPTISE